MKKVFLIISLSIATSLTFAQTAASNLLLGGSIAINSSTDADGASSGLNLNIAPKIGYFIANNFALGAEASYVKQSNQDPYTLFGPFVRYYICTLGPNTKLFSQGSAEFGENANLGLGYTTLGFDAGIAYFLNSNIAAEVALQYKNNTSSKATNYALNVGFQIHFAGKK